MDKTQTKNRLIMLALSLMIICAFLLRTTEVNADTETISETIVTQQTVNQELTEDAETIPKDTYEYEVIFLLSAIFTAQCVLIGGFVVYAFMERMK